MQSIDPGTPQDSTEPAEAHGAGNPSYRGYDYQKTVTVFIALSLFLKEGEALDEIIVEPATQEDIEAHLNVPADEASGTMRIPHASRKILVQIKYRGAGHWRSASIKALFVDAPHQGTRGPSRRDRAKQLLLDDPTRRYVLVTNVSVDAKWSPFRIEEIAASPPKDLVPPGIADCDDERTQLAGRIAVIESLTVTALQAKLRALLEDVAHVPSTPVSEVIDRLKRQVEDRLLGLAQPWTRMEVEAVIRDAGGMPHVDSELAEYREPPDVARARSFLKQHHAVLLVGAPGYGKSLTAKQFIHEHQHMVPPFEIVRGAGIEVIDAALAAPGRHLFFLEDPWGHSKLESDADDWNVQLPRLLRRLGPDKRLVVTSRADILRLALGTNAETPWVTIVCRIDDRSYDDTLRWSILTGKLSSGNLWRHDFIHQHRKRLLRQLRSPLALDRFAKELTDCATPNKVDIDKLIDHAQVESIRRIVAEQVRGWPHDGVACANILWALLRRNQTLQPQRLSALRRELESAPTPLEIDLEQFADHFAPVTFSRAADGALSAHSKVIEALELIVTAHPAESERTLHRSLRAFQHLRHSDPSYSGEFLALADAAISLQNSSRGRISLRPDTRELLDALLIEQLLHAPDREFSGAFHHALRLASDATALLRFIYYLRGAASIASTDDADESPFDFGWRMPKIDTQEIDAIRSAPGARRIAERFIALVLPLDHEHYHAESFLAWLQSFGFDLTAAFLQGYEMIAAPPRYLLNADVVIEGAVSSSAAADDIVFDRIERLERVIEQDQSEEPSADPWQGEIDYAEQLMLQDHREEGGASVDQAVSAYVRARRRRAGYEWIVAHRRPDLIMPAWAQAMAAPRAQVKREELNAYFAAAATDRDRARGIEVIGQKELVAALPTVVAALEHGSVLEMRSAVEALVQLVSIDALEDWIVAAIEKAPPVRQIELMMALASDGHFRDRAAQARLLQNILKRAPNAARDLLSFALLVKTKAREHELKAAFERLPVELVNELLQLSESRLARPLMILSADAGRDVLSAACQWLQSEDSDDVCCAIEALGRLATPIARERIAGLAGQEGYNVRRLVIDTLARDANAAERALILSRVDDRSAPVRERLAALIGEYRWPEGMDVLLKLLLDRRDYAPHPEYSDRPEPQFRVARTAAEALRRFDSLAARIVNAVFEFVHAGTVASEDVELHTALMNTLATIPEPRTVQLFNALLMDDRLVGSRHENLYPVRYAAAWGLVFQLAADPMLIDHVDWPAACRAAGHADPQLAAPSLYLLGLKLSAPTPDVLDAVRLLHETRRVLALLSMQTRSDARAVALRYELLDSAHPLLVSTSDEAGKEGWPVTAELERWLRSLEPDRDVDAVVLKAAEALMPLDLGMADFDAMTLRRKRTTPIQTISELFGME